MAVLVTGASGHVGLTLVQRLCEQGRRVRTLSRYRLPYLSSLPVEFVDGELTEKESLRAAFAEVDVVYHAAGVVSLRANAWPDMERVNVRGTRTIVELCQEHHVRRLIHFSSLEVLDPLPLSRPLDETRPPIASASALPYPRSKLMGQRIVENAIPQGLDAVILYPSAIIGPNDHRVQAGNAFLLQLAKGELLGLVRGGYDWVDVRDVATGAIQAEASAPRGSAYILSNHWASLQEIGRLVELAGGSPYPRLTIPSPIAYLMIAPFHLLASIQGTTPLFTKQSLDAALTSNHHISHQRAADDLGYQPRPLAETVADTLDWFEQLGLFERRGRRERRGRSAKR